MEYVKRALLTATLAAALLVAPSVSYALLIEGELTEDDFFAQDSFSGFYYDFYEFVSTGTDPITITLGSDAFAPFLAWGVAVDLPPWPTGSDAPYGSFEGSFCAGSPGSNSLTFDSPSAGQSFQVMVATCNYFPTPLGTYTLTIDGDIMSVPEPGSLALLGMGLVGLAFSRRRKRLI